MLNTLILHINKSIAKNLRKCWEVQPTSDKKLYNSQRSQTTTNQIISNTQNSPTGNPNTGFTSMLKTFLQIPIAKPHQNQISKQIFECIRSLHWPLDYQWPSTLTLGTHLKTT